MVFLQDGKHSAAGGLFGDIFIHLPNLFVSRAALPPSPRQKHQQPWFLLHEVTPNPILTIGLDLDTLDSPSLPGIWNWGRRTARWASLLTQQVKNPPANGDTRDARLIPGSGVSPGEGNGNPLHYSSLENPVDRGTWSQRRQWQPTPVLLPGKSHGRRSLVGCSRRGC